MRQKGCRPECTQPCECLRQGADWLHGADSLAAAEFEDHRPLYDWILDQLPVPSRPRQIEFSRLNLQYCVVSKRKLIQLVREGHVDGWDDPRMPTICGLRRRGVPPEALRLFVDRTGVSKADNNIDYSVGASARGHTQMPPDRHVSESCHGRHPMAPPHAAPLRTWPPPCAAHSYHSDCTTVRAPLNGPTFLMSGWRDGCSCACKLLEDCTHANACMHAYTSQVLEDCTREVLDAAAPRALAVLDPIKVVITTWPAGEVDMLEAPMHPKMPELGMRSIPFSGTVLIDRADFEEDPPKKYNRLKPGGEVRLRYGYVISCDEVIKDETGRVVELRCSHEPGTRQGAGKKVKGIIHWLSEAHAVRGTVRLYDRLFNTPSPGSGYVHFRLRTSWRFRLRPGT